MTIIQTDGLGKEYGNKKAVDNVSLVVERNSVYGLIGCNGAGKTTTISLLSGLVRKSSGTIKIDGKLFDQDDEKIKRDMGVMPQKMEPYPRKTAFANMLYYAKLKGIEKYQAIDQIVSLFKEFQAEDIKNIKAGKLSHGQAKTILILQAFLGEPKIVMLDEPISGFDPQKTVVFREFIKRKSKQMAILISSHELSQVDKMCTHIGILNEGRLIAQGKKENVKKGKSLERAFLEKV